MSSKKMVRQGETEKLSRIEACLDKYLRIYDSSSNAKNNILSKFIEVGDEYATTSNPETDDNRKQSNNASNSSNLPSRRKQDSEKTRRKHSKAKRNESPHRRKKHSERSRSSPVRRRSYYSRGKRDVYSEPSTDAGRKHSKAKRSKSASRRKRHSDRSRPSPVRSRSDYSLGKLDVYSESSSCYGETDESSSGSGTDLNEGAESSTDQYDTDYTRSEHNKDKTRSELTDTDYSRNQSEADCTRSEYSWDESETDYYTQTDHTRFDYETDDRSDYQSDYAASDRASCRRKAFHESDFTESAEDTTDAGSGYDSYVERNRFRRSAKTPQKSNRRSKRDARDDRQEAGSSKKSLVPFKDQDESESGDESYTSGRSNDRHLTRSRDTRSRTNRDTPKKHHHNHKRSKRAGVSESGNILVSPNAVISPDDKIALHEKPNEPQAEDTNNDDKENRTQGPTERHDILAKDMPTVSYEGQPGFTNANLNFQKSENEAGLEVCLITLQTSASNATPRRDNLSSVNWLYEPPDLRPLAELNESRTGTKDVFGKSPMKDKNDTSEKRTAKKKKRLEMLKQCWKGGSKTKPKVSVN